MKHAKKLLALLLALTMVFSLVACGGSNTSDGNNDAPVVEVENNDDATDAQTGDETEAPVGTDGEAVYVREDDEDIYEEALGEYAELLAAAEDPANSVDERFVLFAKAEAALLDSAVMIPTTTQGGNYAISRVAPRTIPYVQWGNDDDRLHGLVISDEFITKEEREDLMELWRAAMAGEGAYDPAAYLTEKGHTIQNTYTTYFTTAPVTLSGRHRDHREHR